MAQNEISTALQQVERNLTALRKRFQQMMRGRALAKATLAKLKRVPGAPSYPLRWTSEKQRRAFFASGGFGKGIPAKRGSPPQVTQGWAAEFIPTGDGGIVALSNPVPHMQYVQGWQAQRFHVDTGWVQLADVEADFFRESESAVVEAWHDLDLLEGV